MSTKNVGSLEGLDVDQVSLDGASGCVGTRKKGGVWRDVVRSPEILNERKNGVEGISVGLGSIMFGGGGGRD